MQDDPFIDNDFENTRSDDDSWNTVSTILKEKMKAPHNEKSRANAECLVDVDR